MGDPSMFHEYLYRQSFKQRPVKGTGSGVRVQRAIMSGGTLENGKVRVYFRRSHGVTLRELIAMVTFEHHDCVTCYGGFEEPAPASKLDGNNHMRHIPCTRRVLNGLPFADCFPTVPGVMFDLGLDAPLRPRCDNPAWSHMIRTSGIGYMANTVTKCPMRLQPRPNVTIQSRSSYRQIDGVSCGSVLYLECGVRGIAVGDPIVSPYEGWAGNPEFRFECVDQDHYARAGLEFRPETL
jgi:hypothetical protein